MFPFKMSYIKFLHFYYREKEKKKKNLRLRYINWHYFLNIQLKISNRVEKYIIKSKFFSALQSNVLYILPEKNVYVYVSIICPHFIHTTGIVPHMSYILSYNI